MFYIDTSRDGHPVYDAIVNQSIDNYLVNDLKLKGHGLMLYINQPSVIVGIHQNIVAEVSFPYLDTHQVQVVRRTSGGGTVYHDQRNLIFENIVNGTADNGGAFGDYTSFATPMLEALHAMGVTKATIAQKSNLVVDGKKFSGMTMFKNGDGFAAGGTLMFDLNTDAAHQALRPEEERLRGRGVKSNRVPITNLRPYLAAEYQNLDSEAFKQELLKHLFKVDDVAKIETYHLSKTDWAIIDQRLAEKYATDAWNYGANPGFTAYHQAKFNVGMVRVNTNIRDQQMIRFSLFGAFPIHGDLADFNQALEGIPATYDSVLQALKAAKATDVFGITDLPRLTQLILGEEVTDES